MSILISDEIKKCIYKELQSCHQSIIVITAFCKQNALEFMQKNCNETIKDRVDTGVGMQRSHCGQTEAFATGEIEPESELEYLNSIFNRLHILNEFSRCVVFLGRKM